MARAYTRKNISIDENIRIQEDAVAKAKERYDKEVSKLKDMYAYSAKPAQPFQWNGALFRFNLNVVQID